MYDYNTYSTFSLHKECTYMGEIKKILFIELLEIAE